MDAMTEIQRWNLIGLMCMRDSARADITAAMVRFNLNREAVEHLRDMAPNGILELVQQAGEQMLFKPGATVAPLLNRALQQRPADHVPGRAVSYTLPSSGFPQPV